MGPTYQALSSTATNLFLSVYLHGIELFFVLVEFFLFKHKFIPSYCKDVSIITAFYAVYVGLIFMAKYSLGFDAYGFEDGAEIRPLIIAMIIIYIIILNYYALYQSIVQKKYENRTEIANFRDRTLSRNASNAN